MTAMEQMLSSPRLPQYVRELQEILDAEKERRRQFFDEVREDQKAAFINGEVVVHSPVTIEHHDASFGLATLFRAYVNTHDLGYVGHEKLLVSLTRNDYEPDICFFASPKARKFKPGQMKFPAPDLIVEVLSRSTKQTDRKTKFEDYAAHGVTEYWIVDPRKRTVEQYLLASHRYELAVKLKNGVIRSRAIKGFAIDVRAIFDKQANLKAMQEMLKT